MQFPKIKNPLVKNILSCIFVAGVGFILLNLTFMLDYLFQMTILGLIKLVMAENLSADLMTEYSWFPPVMHIMFILLVILISCLVFKSKLRILFKAAFLTVPLAVVFVTVGIFLYQWPLISYAIGGLIFIGIFYYFYRTRQPWLYYYSLILISLVLFIGGLLGMEI